MSASVFSVKASSLSRYKSSNVEVSCRLKPLMLRNVSLSQSQQAGVVTRELPKHPLTALMGRTRPKNRKARPPIDDLAERHEEKGSGPTVEALLEKTQELIVQCDYNLAGRFLDRVLKRAPDNAEAKEMLGVVQLETGLLDAAKLVRFHVTSMCVGCPNATY